MTSMDNHRQPLNFGQEGPQWRIDIQWMRKQGMLDDQQLSKRIDVPVRTIGKWDNNEFPPSELLIGSIRSARVKLEKEILSRASSKPLVVKEATKESDPKVIKEVLVNMPAQAQSGSTNTSDTVVEVAKIITHLEELGFTKNKIGGLLNPPVGKFTVDRWSMAVGPVRVQLVARREQLAMLADCQTKQSAEWLSQEWKQPDSQSDLVNQGQSADELPSSLAPEELEPMVVDEEEAAPQELVPVRAHAAVEAVNEVVAIVSSAHQEKKSVANNPPGILDLLHIFSVPILSAALDGLDPDTDDITLKLKNSAHELTLKLRRR